MERVTRRDFLLKYVPVGALAVATMSKQMAQFFNGGWLFDSQEEHWLDRIEDYSVIKPKFALPNGINEVFVNSPYLYEEEQEGWQFCSSEAKKIGANRIRILTGKNVEPKVGRIDEGKIKRIAQLAGFLKNQSDGRARLAVSLFDCFELGNGVAFNPAYGSVRPTSPYNTTADWDGYRKFFTDKSLKDWEKVRFETLVRKLKQEYGINNISAWSVANEPLPSCLYTSGIAKNDSVEELTQWFAEMVGAIRNVDLETPVLAGVGDPAYINESKIPGLSANTLHAYPFGIGLEAVGGYLKSSARIMPVEVEEAGFPQTLAGKRIPLEITDNLFSNYLRELVDHCWIVDHKRKTVEPTFTSFGGWQISSQHVDGFRFTQSELPKTIGLLEKINRHVFLPLNQGSQ